MQTSKSFFRIVYIFECIYIYIICFSNGNMFLFYRLLGCPLCVSSRKLTSLNERMQYCMELMGIKWKTTEEYRTELIECDHKRAADQEKANTALAVAEQQ